MYEGPRIRMLLIKDKQRWGHAPEGCSGGIIRCLELERAPRLDLALGDNHTQKV